MELKNSGWIILFWLVCRWSYGFYVVLDAGGVCYQWWIDGHSQDHVKERADTWLSCYSITASVDMGH